ncbi:MAG: oligoendopeptidase F [Eubacteriales bacterium]|nr:oligoendopeptidase F [Eubacteriales bacterium]
METQADPPREPMQPDQNDQADRNATPLTFEKRADIPLSARWRLTDIFADAASWETTFSQLPEQVLVLSGYRGRLSASAANLAAALRLSSQIEMTCLELLAYARMHKDEDNKQATYQALTDRITAFYYQFAESASYIQPELARIPETLLKQWQIEESDLATFHILIDDSIRNRPHTLSEAEESLLSRFGPTSEGINDVFGMLDHVELDLGEFPTDEGQPGRLTQGRFAQLREHPDRTIRENAFRQIHESYAKFGRTIAALYATRVKTDIAYSTARKHPDTLTSALFSDNLPPTIVTGLIGAIEEGLPTLYRYLELRRRLMNVPELHIYDTYVPIVAESKRHFTYDQACDLVRNGLKPLGAQYLSILDKHLTDRWIDVYETPGKTTGAYSWGTYQSHPYVLLNFSGLLNDVFTLAHEVGHSLHTYFSSKQPFETSHYPIFLAEIASTVNENLLIRHLLSQNDPSTPEGKAERIGLLNHFLEEFRLTVFRQTMFAEFEYQAHAKAEANEPLTADALTSLYRGLLVKYFGEAVVIDDYMQWEWSRIPHFYNAYYVYKYATGFSAAVALSSKIIEDGQPAVDRYLNFLAAGGSDYPLNTLKKTGVDLSSPEPIRAALSVFAQTLTELESLLAEVTT